MNIAIADKKNDLVLLQKYDKLNRRDFGKDEFGIVK